MASWHESPFVEIVDLVEAAPVLSSGLAFPILLAHDLGMWLILNKLGTIHHIGSSRLKLFSILRILHTIWILHPILQVLWVLPI